MGGEEIDSTIVTPVESPGLIARILTGPTVMAFAGRFGASLARRRGKPFRFGTRVIAVRHADVCELLCRDLDFAIAPVNAVKIDEVNDGPFVLGMDRSGQLEVERRALYEALGAVDMAALKRAVEAEIDEKLGAVPAGGKIDVVGGYARPIAAHTAQRLFGIKGPSDGMFMEVIRSIFAHTFLNLSNDPVVRDRAVKAGRYMSGWLAAEIGRRRASYELGDDMMGQLMQQAVLDDNGVRRTLGGMLVGSIDTTTTCVAKIIALAGRDKQLELSIRRDVDDLDRLYGWCNEALRLWPHNPIVLRAAVADCELAGQPVKAGDSVIAATLPAMYDASVFPEPRKLRPDRDGAAYLHLGAGLHPCSGRPVNRFQIPLLVGALVRRGLARVERIGWAGSFPNELTAVLAKGHG